jgi:hypothetical protein
LLIEQVFDRTGGVTAAALPRRDEVARARLREVAGRAQPLTLARERLLPVAEPLGELLPGGGLRRGTVVSVEGTGATGATSLGFTLAAAATDIGEWAAAVDLHGTLGMEAAAASGVALERFPVVRHVSADHWATVVAALLDGITVVLAEVPRQVRAGDARRLVARARERDAVLVALPAPGATWAGDAALRIMSEGGPWAGASHDAGPITGRVVRVRVGGRGEAARHRVGALARTG